MPDLGGMPALEVAIGLVALFFLLSTAISAINEGISNVLGWRAKTLEDAIRNLVGDPPVRQGLKDFFLEGGWKRIGRVDKPAGDTTVTLFEHWRMRALVRDPDSDVRRRARPSYVPPRAFTLALAEWLAARPPEAGGPADVTPWEQADDEIFTRVRNAAAGLPQGQLRSLAMKAAINAEETLDGFRAQVERAFNDSMERASGWYKRKVQVVLLVLATVVAIGLNVNTVGVATALWNDEALRTSVAARASEQGTPEDAADAFDDISALDLPVGWGANAPDDVPSAIPGWLVTIAALQLGAPFWFDLLSRLSRLRGSGVPEKPRSLSDTAGSVPSSV
jgi:hypothetical protein